MGVQPRQAGSTPHERLKQLSSLNARLRAQVELREKEIHQLRSVLAAGADTDDNHGGIKAEQIVWIFGSGRTGSTWLGRMLGELPGCALWNEPAVGSLFGDFYYMRFGHRHGRMMIMGDRYESVWMAGIRSIVIEGASARFGDLDPAGHLVIKEPHGASGAPLLARAIPESRMVLLVRDPRDVVASALKAHTVGSWAKGKHASSEMTGAVRARSYLWDMHKASQAYVAHRGPKAVIRYEDLRHEALEVMSQLCHALKLSVGERELAGSVETQSWEAIPDDQKGESKFHRRATPGSWEEDLTAEQRGLVEDIARPVLAAFYPGWERGPATKPSSTAPDDLATLEVAPPTSRPSGRDRV